MLTDLKSRPSGALETSPPGGHETLRSGVTIGSAHLASAVFLAPLSGITDVPFRRVVRSFGTELVYSEMVASGELIKGSADSLQRASADGGGLHAVQLAGRDAEPMHQASAFLAGEGADIIDINMGCPAKKVVGGLSGSALMRDLDHAMRLIEATVAGAAGVPVTLKMRLGWDAASINAPDLAARAESAGVRLVTVHGRTRDQFYEGQANWTAIAAVKAAVGIPVIANGDLLSQEDHAAMRGASRADGVMIGRGACGRPWFPALVAGVADPSRLDHAFADLVLGHYEDMLSYYGIAHGVRHARKHLGWYLDTLQSAGIKVASSERAGLLQSSDSRDVCRKLVDLFGRVKISELQPGLCSELRSAA